MMHKLSSGSTPQPGERAADGDAAWRQAMWLILNHGAHVDPRGYDTIELMHQGLISYDMARPVVTSAARKLNYGFMAAEARWILSGSNELAPLTKHVKRMAEFSDDGKTLSGAYGPPVTAQIDYVVDKLLEDADTRQAVLTIWRPNPQPSKDIPCTVAMVFSSRAGRLQQHVFMRSSDVWLGVPYDMFSFALTGLYVACRYNTQQSEPGFRLLPGTVTITATSSHLYLRDREKAFEALRHDPAPAVEPVPDELILNARWNEIQDDLDAVDDGRPPRSWRFIP